MAEGDHADQRRRSGRSDPRSAREALTSSLPTAAVLVTTTLDSEEAALVLARSVIEEGLAACVHIGPVTSVYRWEGRIEETREWSCQMKTLPARVPALFDRIRALHPYQVPEILAVPITAVAPTYLQWMAESVRDS